MNSLRQAHDRITKKIDNRNMKSGPMDTIHFDTFDDMVKPLYSIPVALACFLVFSVSAQPRRDSLRVLFDTLYARQSFSGTVLVAENGIPLFDTALGFSDQKKRIPLNLTTLFELASVSKQFTAMAVMQLREQGKLSYEDPLLKYFPELPFHGVTIRNLLTHTSGIPEFLGWPGRAVNPFDTSRINFNQDILEKLPKLYDSAAFPAGSEFSYSNTNYVLLALIVEKLSGMPFADYMRKYVFIPAGMKHTFVYSRRSAPRPLPNYALSYVWDAGDNQFVEPETLAFLRYTRYLDGVAGPYGISSNVEDLLRWDQALYTEKLIRSSSLNDAFTPFTMKNNKTAGFGDASPYGFGWMMFSGDSLTGPSQFHTGSYPGYQTSIIRYPPKHWTVILLTNSTDIQNIYSILAAIENILTGKAVEIPERVTLSHSITLSPEQLSGLAGTYTQDSAGILKMVITRQGKNVFARLTDQVRVQIYPDSADTFF